MKFNFWRHNLVAGVGNAKTVQIDRKLLETCKSGGIFRFWNFALQNGVWEIVIFTKVQFRPFFNERILENSPLYFKMLSHISRSLLVLQNDRGAFWGKCIVFPLEGAKVWLFYKRNTKDPTLAAILKRLKVMNQNMYLRKSVRWFDGRNILKFQPTPKHSFRDFKKTGWFRR